MNLSRLIFPFLFIAIVSCEGQEPRHPIKHHSGSFIKESAVKNKEIYEKERAFLENLIAQDSSTNYIVSDHGFWYFYHVKDSTNTTNPELGDRVQFTYDLRNIRDETIVSEEENGIQDYTIDQSNQDLFSGIREGLKLMKEGEKITFLFPSYKAYGYYGLANKIGSNIPIKSTVTLISITENNQD